MNKLLATGTIALLLALLLLPLFVHGQEVEQVAGKDGPRKGFFKISLTPVELFGDEGAASVAQIFDKNETLEWQLYVPQNYDASRPAGVMVYISPWERGASPRSWNEVMAEHNLIWIGAENSGNEVAVTKRMFLAMFAPMVLQRDYVLEPERVYISGFSGGGRTASRVAVLRPNIFKGGIFISGAIYWGKDKPLGVDEVRKMPYVFVSGSQDFSLGDTEEAYRKWTRADVEHSKLIVIPNHGHDLPSEKYMSRAIAHLDSLRMQGGDEVR